MLVCFVDCYEFRYQGHLFARKCYVCEQVMSVHRLFMNNCLLKSELKKNKIFQTFRIFQDHHTMQLNAIPARPLKPVFCEGQCHDVGKNDLLCDVTQPIT